MADSPAGAPLNLEDREIHEAIASLAARVRALEERPHVGEAEYLSFEGSPDSAGVGFNLHHSLGRVPKGAILIAVGVLADGLSMPSDVKLTMNVPRSDAKTVRLVLRRMVTASATTRTFHVLLF